jgi:thiol-disulfide isomerase/thioredoxin
MARGWVLLAAGLLTTATPAPAALGAGAQAERKAPSIQLKTLEGRNVRLADRKGRIVIVDFWASWCAPCRATFPALNALAVELKERGVDVVAVNEDEKRRNLDAFLAGAALSLDVLIDPRGDAANAFAVTAIPSMYVIDQAGTVRFSHPDYSTDVIGIVKGETLSLAAVNSAD